MARAGGTSRSRTRPKAEERPAGPHALPAWSLALLVALVVGVYARTLGAEFLRWDDADHVYENPRVTASDGLARSWSETRSPGFYPVTYTSFYLEWHAARGAPWLFHLDNVLLHAASALLVARLGLVLGAAPVASWFMAALWALHPIQVASVAWIAERKNVLFTFCWLGSLLLFVRAHERGARARTPYILSLVLFALALFSKGAAMTLPVALVIVRWARGEALDRGFWLAVLPYVALALGAGVMLLGGVPAGLQIPSLATRLTLPPRIVAFYVAKFVWPDGLLPVYPRWPLPPPTAASWLPWLGLVAVGAAVFAVRERVPRVAVAGIALFLANVSLVLGVAWFTYFDHALVADHLAYLPTLGLAVAVVGAAEAARLPARGLAVALACWCAALAFLTWRQIPVWRDTETLWTYTIARNPDCALCHYNLGALLADRGDTERAAAHYETALRVRPDAEAAINLGNLRVREGRFADAEALYARAVALDSTNEKGQYNLGLVLANRGRIEDAIARFREAIRLVPDFPDAHRYLGDTLLAAERPDEAEAEYRTALRLAPDDADAERGLGRTAAARGRWEEAVTHLAKAVRGKDGAAGVAVRRELGEALVQLDRYDEAIAHYRAAAALDPESTEIVTDLVGALLASHRVEEAIAVLRERLGRTPDDATAAGALAWVRATSRDARWRDAAEAVRLAERARDSTPHPDADQLDTLAAAYAEAGRFEDASRVGGEALAAAEQDSEQASEIRERLRLYRTRTPYRSDW